MAKFYEYLDNIESVGSTIVKEKLLTEFITIYDKAETFLRLAFNDNVYGLDEKTFYNAFQDLTDITRFRSVSDFLVTIEGRDSKMLDVEDLISFSKDILKLSGNDLIVGIRTFFDDLAKEKKKWWSRALLHDLRMGVQVKSVNKVFKALGKKEIQKFALQLCDKIDVYDEKLVKKKITFPCSMECKYDGIRIQADIEYDSTSDFTFVTLISRRGKDNTEKYPSIVNELRTLFHGQSVILDGEVISRSFQSLTRKDDHNEKKYIVFDLLLQESLPYRDRWLNLVNLFTETGITEVTFDNNNLGYLNLNNTVLLAEHYTAENIDDLQKYYEELNERQEEGIIIKLETKSYERGSRKNMFKCKKVFTAELRITGYKMGDGKRTNKVSTLCLEDLSKTIKVDVGSGIDDITSDFLTEEVENNDSNFVGKICEIKFNEITETKSIRFPRFVCIREDKDEPDDLSNSSIRQSEDNE